MGGGGDSEITDQLQMRQKYLLNIHLCILGSNKWPRNSGDRIESWSEGFDDCTPAPLSSHPADSRPSKPLKIPFKQVRYQTGALFKTSRKAQHLPNKSTGSGFYLGEYVFNLGFSNPASISNSEEQFEKEAKASCLLSITKNNKCAHHRGFTARSGCCCAFITEH